MPTDPKFTAFEIVERSTGKVCFKVQATKDGELPVDHVSGLLAMHCIGDGRRPEDFDVKPITRKGIHVVKTDA